MNQLSVINKRLMDTTFRYAYLLRSLFAGLLIPFGFAPFHFPGLALLGIGLLFAQLNIQKTKNAFLIGFVFGLGFLGLGVSWVYVSIREYGHLNLFLSFFITSLFVIYLALFPGFMALIYKALAPRHASFLSSILFSALWCLAEYLRATFLSGFPWLLLGYGQIDTPLKYLLPIIGVYGVGFIACSVGTFLSLASTQTSTKRYIYIFGFVGLLLTPNALKFVSWCTLKSQPLSVGVIQANISMRDKWDEHLFWKIMQYYENDVARLMGKKQLIVMPESAIPVPINYISDFLEDINLKGKQTNTAILFGIPQPTNSDELYYYNSLTARGAAQGSYYKQHLVAFGEYIPKPFQQLMTLLALPPANMKAGKATQDSIMVHDHPIASLICYELAYPELLRKQLPKAEWIVSVSDDGWFGHSLAMYQHLQMAQVLSILSTRFQIIANNDGLSSVINQQGEIIASLPAFSRGILQAEIYPATGSTPWINWGDAPTLFFSGLIVLYLIARQRLQKIRSFTELPQTESSDKKEYCSL